MSQDPPRTQQPRQVVVTRKVEVVRVVAQTVAIDPDYARVELVIDGNTFLMDRPDAQILGQMLARAAGADA
jgi:hypothetical protein